MQQGPLKAQGSAAPCSRKLLTNEDRDGRRMRSMLHPNTKLSTSSHAQRSVSDALIMDTRHLHRYCSAMVTAPPLSLTPAHCSPATLRQRLGDSVANYACVLQPCSATAAPGKQRRLLRLRISAPPHYGLGGETASSTGPAPAPRGYNSAAGPSTRGRSAHMLHLP